MKTKNINLYKDTFSKRLKEARLVTGFTQKEVAMEISINDSALSKYESGTLEPSIEILGKLANFYGTSIDWLFGLGMQPGGRPSYDNVRPKSKVEENREEKRIAAG
jgi:transcriptional regulator with XRE-family HTH domain